MACSRHRCDHLELSCWTKTMAELNLYILFVPLLIIPVLYYASKRLAASRSSGRRLPPGPWALPVIGHLHHLAGALPHHAMRKLSRRHGPLMLLRLGEVPVIVASSADAAREIMKTHDLNFASRFIPWKFRVCIQEGAEGLTVAPYGDGWRQLRKICTIELLSSRRVHSFRDVREEEVGRLLRSIVSAPPTQEVNLSKRISAYISDSAVRAIIGSRFTDRDTFLRLLERGLKLFSSMSLPDLFPSSRLTMLVSQVPRQAKRHVEEVMAFMDTIIEEHQVSRASGDEEDLLDVLLRIQREGDLQFPLTMDNIKAVVSDMFGAGSETSATMLQWIMAELVRNPRVMQKVQEEVRCVLEGQARVTEESLSHLHYLQLVIKEALRLHPPAPLLIPRECRSACRILGYDVPKGAMVVVNVWAIGRDPIYWDTPEEFLPERFKQSDIDFKGTDFEYIPFGAGRRICPGMAFGLANIELALASLLFHFDWVLPDGMGTGDLDMTETMGLTARQSSDLLLIPVVRVPVPVD